MPTDTEMLEFVIKSLAQGENNESVAPSGQKRFVLRYFNGKYFCFSQGKDFREAIAAAMKAGELCA